MGDAIDRASHIGGFEHGSCPSTHSAVQPDLLARLTGRSVKGCLTLSTLAPGPDQATRAMPSLIASSRASSVAIMLR